MVFVSTLIIFLGFNSSAADSDRNCSEVDLSGSFPPLRSQGNWNWCLAESMADVLGAALGKTVSAVDLAVNARFYADQKKGKPPAEYRLPGQGVAGSADATSPLTLPELVEFIDAQGYCLESKAVSTASLEIRGLRAEAPDLHALAANPILSPAEQKTVEAMTAPKSKQALKFTSSNEDLNVRNRIHAVCGARIKLPGNTAKDLLKRLGQHSRRKETGTLSGPMKARMGAVGYHIEESLAQQQPVVAIVPGGTLWKKSVKDVQPFHSLVIVGRHFDSTAKRCQYLVRDSLRPNCLDLLSGISCDSNRGVFAIDRQALQPVETVSVPSLSSNSVQGKAPKDGRQ